MTKKNEKEIFEEAFWLAVSGIDAPRQILEELLPLLYSKFRSGDVDNGLTIFSLRLPDGSWGWKEYARQKEGLRNSPAKTLLNRIWRLAHTISQNQRMIETVDSFPYWMLSVPEPANAAEICRKNDGNVRHWRDPFWKEHFPPCAKLDCLCRIIPMTAGMVTRRGLKTK